MIGHSQTLKKNGVLRNYLCRGYMVLISASRLVCDLVWSWGQAAGSLDRLEDTVLQWEGAGRRWVSSHQPRWVRAPSAGLFPSERGCWVWALAPCCLWDLVSLCPPADWCFCSRLAPGEGWHL